VTDREEPFDQPGTPEEPKGHYIFDKPEPLWNFGHGKSYTTFDYVDCALSDTLLAASDTLKVSVMIKNTGRCDGKEVVQLYVRDKVSTVATPIQQLKAFQKELVPVGYTREVKLVLPIAELALYNADMEEVIEPGEFELQIGSASDDIRIRRTIIVR
jgi:beta-glucosidase